MNPITTTNAEAHTSATQNNLADIRRVTDVALDDLEPHPLSTAIYGNEDESTLVESVRKEGVLTPLIVNSANSRIVSGNTRYKACKVAKCSTVPVMYVTLTEEEEKIRLVTSNVARIKTNTQRTLEFNALLEIFKAKARVGEKDESDTTAGLKKSQDKAAAIVGLGAASLKKGAAVLAAAETLEAKGDKDGSEKLRKLLDGQRGFDPSFKAAVKMGVIAPPKKRSKKNKQETNSDVPQEGSLEEVTSAEDSQGNSAEKTDKSENSELATIGGDGCTKKVLTQTNSSPVSKLEGVLAELVPLLETLASWTDEEKAAAAHSLQKLEGALATTRKAMTDAGIISVTSLN